MAGWEGGERIFEIMDGKDRSEIVSFGGERVEEDRGRGRRRRAGDGACRRKLGRRTMLDIGNI